MFNSVGEFCYEGILLFFVLVECFGSFDVWWMIVLVDLLFYVGLCGEVCM